jgi:hypothetical protein
MSNIKEITFQLEVPYNWMERLPDEDAARWGRLLLSPTINLYHTYESSRYVPSGHANGKLSMYWLEVNGQEALSYSYIDALKSSLDHLGGFCTIDVWEIDDIQARLAEVE